MFPAVVALYGLSSGAYLAYFYSARGLALARWAARGAWILQSASLLKLLVATGHPPFYTLPGAIVFFTWVVALHVLLVDGFLGFWAAGVFVIPLLFLALGYASFIPSEPALHADWLRGHWLLLHVVLALASYSTFAVAFAAAVMYLLQERQLHGKVWGLIYRRLPSLEELDRLSYRSVVLGFPLLTLAILSGAIWARHVWGQYWNWHEPKEVWALITWAIYGAYLWIRSRAGWGGRKAACLAVTGFAAALYNFLIVSLYLAHIHAFG